MLTLSQSGGIKGIMKQTPEDFVVSEITEKGAVLEPNTKYESKDILEESNGSGKFTTFVLQKKNWSTINALISIAKKVGRGQKSIGYAGSKDKFAVTTQLASIFGASPEQMLSVAFKDIAINGAWRSNGVELGSNLGNRFQVVVKDIEGDATSIEGILSELNRKIPNYFDSQRFGYRLNNAIVGIHILNNDFEAAALEFLTNAKYENENEAKDARLKLAAELKFDEACGYFPRRLGAELSVLRYLSVHSGDYANAIRKIPHGIRIMFIHAVQSLIFNLVLEERVREGNFDSMLRCQLDSYGFPDVGRTGEGDVPLGCLIGYETKDTDISEYERKAMEQLGIEKSVFKISGMPELSMKGSFRPILAPFKDFSFEIEGHDVKLSFSLPAGAYATVFLEELMKSKGFKLSACMPDKPR